MARILILDSDPAWLICHSEAKDEARLFQERMKKERDAGALVVIPEIVDYEVRRALTLAEASGSLDRLDALYRTSVRYLPITTAAIRRATGLWAEVRRQGKPTAGKKALDGDVILAAQALEFCFEADDWQILTENVGHLERYVGHRARSRRVGGGG